MKTKIFFFAALVLCNPSFSQKNKKEPKNMSFIPQGSFIMQKDTMRISVSVDAFWMSNEITNKEYREFYNYVKNNPNDSLCFIHLIKTSTEAIRNKDVRCFKNAEIVNDLIDTSVWSKEFSSNPDLHSRFKNYFIKKEFDNFPVVGVSYKAAQFYCIWKTKMENAKQKQKDKSISNNYRLPLEEEWAFVAAQPLVGPVEKPKENLPQPVTSGNVNEWGLYNIYGNVSEWTASSPAFNANNDITKKIVKGGSWKTEKSINEREQVDENTKTSFIGFRIVKTYWNADKTDVKQR